MRDLNPSRAISFENVSIVFGNNPEAALELVDQNRSREDILKETGQLVGVANASFDIEEGELLVLMGLSGSGKSTLLRAINGLNPISRGAVHVSNGDALVNPGTCSTKDLRELRRHGVAMVFQQFALLPWRTVRSNIGFGLELSGISGVKKRELVERQLELVGLKDYANKYVHELSGGMQQRVGLARAFATDAPILLMDEPFSALDPLIRAHLQDELLELQQQLNKTIVFVSHDLDEAAKLGSRIAIMEGGHVVQIGTPQEIVTKPVDEYVANFVSHMNPLNVLRAKDIMTPVAVTEAPVHEAGRPNCLADAPLRQVIEVKKATNEPITVLDHGKVVGSITESDILSSLSSSS
ncbi:choline ABC transporter ATP-binding protein [Pseudovibrio exalbescens]|uniref:choline ABC transporter ATP-binding protein n=1 Tax=Pseudovibrio exalbescens TaxID=197461 RepID=UPI0023669DB1|nr:choline ABC transporter ATP-binding protein [Pseudovibrio exalbescens]MDD7909076.1 choline ABC transporter ATP-binding protein [Pseudovibrio exalbescens]